MAESNRDATREQDAASTCCVSAGRAGGVRLTVAFLLGMLAAGGLMFVLMPKLMIVTHESRYGVEETVSRLKESIEAHGWVVSGVSDMNASLTSHGKTLEPQVRVVRLCQPEYAKRVLEDDRYVSCLMPCAFGVWEDAGGTVRISKMNTGLMGRMFGGTVAEVMGGKVGPDEAKILAAVVTE